MSSDGFLVTNYHVVDGCDELRITVGDQATPALVVDLVPEADLALLKSSELSSKALPVGSENPKLLQEIVVAGYPFGGDLGGSVKITRGVVSSTSGIGDNNSEFQIDAAIQPGNSGGPIIDISSGSVVGVAVAKLDFEEVLSTYGVIPENVNFGVKISEVLTMLERNEIQTIASGKGPIPLVDLGKNAETSTVLLSCLVRN